MSDRDDLPDYAGSLAAYHAAFGEELAAMVASLPIEAGMRVLDVACGDGTYSRLLAARVGGDGSVWALDADPAFLDLAGSSGGDPTFDRLRFVAGTLERPPFEEGTFDLAWCAQSLYSLPEPVGALRRIARLVKPGGGVAVLEADTLHQVLLPWPVEVELALRQAEWAGFNRESGRPRKYYVGRDLLRVCREAGLISARRRTWASDRQGPLDRPTRFFLAEQLRELRERASPRLRPEMKARAERLLDPRSTEYLLDQPDLAVTIIDHVVTAIRP